MKLNLRKLLVILLIILTLNNFLLSPSYAVDPPDVNSKPAWVEILEGFLGSIIGLLTLPIRALAVGAALGINALAAAVAYVDGTTADSTQSNVDIRLGNVNVITPFDIFFNKIKILDVNFFDIGTDNTLTNQIRTSIAVWYYVLRNIAVAILLVILIYVGIRMAISTVATDKAMYKKMLFDWVASLALVFIIQYIIIFTVNVNQSIIKAIEFGVDSEKISNTYGTILSLALALDLDSFAATVIFCMLVWQTFGLIISYFNRMLKLAFLVIISPLITLTYSIDKMGDGKAQALGAWLKEFIYTILIQPFHCIIYMCFVDIAFNLLITNTTGDPSSNTLGVSVVAILCVHFVKEAEKLIRKIFAFKDDNSSTSMTAGLAMAGLALNQSKNIGKGARNMINGARYTKGAISSAFTGAKVGALAIGSKIANPEKSYAEHKSDVRTNINNKKAEKMSNKKYYKNVTVASIEKEKQRIMQSAPGISEAEAESIAKLNVAKRARNENGAVRKHITKARGKINKLKEVASHNTSLKVAGSLAKLTLSSSMGLMVGSGVYGTNGNFATALTAGTAMFSGTQAFQKTAGTLEARTIDNLRGLGVKDQMGAVAELDNLLNNSNLYDGKSDESVEKAKELLDRVGKALEAAGIDSKYKTHIKNTIENGIRANPAQASRIVQEALDGLKYQGKSDAFNGKSSNVSLVGVSNDSSRTPLSRVNGGELLNATQDLADFINRKEIYQQIQTAGNFNIDADTFVGDVASKFDDIGVDYSDEVVDTGLEEVSTATEFTDNRSKVDEETRGLSNGQLEELDMEFERRKEEYRRQAANPDLTIDEQAAVTETIRNLEREQTDIIARALADSDRDLTTISGKLVEKYEEKLELAIKQVEEEIKQQQMELDSLQNRYNIGNNDHRLRERGIKSKMRVANESMDLLVARSNRLKETQNNLFKK